MTDLTLEQLDALLDAVVGHIIVAPVWQPIEVEPKAGTVAVLYTPPEVGDADFDGLDYRYDLAIFRETEIGRNWHEQGTNHLVRECEYFGGAMPSHWMPLPTPPKGE